MTAKRMNFMLRSTLSITAVLLAAACSDTPSAPSTVALPAANSDVEGPSTFASHGPEYANISNQGGGGVYAANGAQLVRQPNGLRASISMPTPQPGTYSYPAGKTSGHPEVFTLWAFVFNYPDLCSGACGSDDLGVATPAKGGVYNVGGHAASGQQLVIAGRIGVGQTPFNHAPLESPSTAEVHLAVAPHGGLDPSTLPEEFRLPTGPNTFWWIAIFD